jgi:hypothetical protein
VFVKAMWSTGIYDDLCLCYTKSMNVTLKDIDARLQQLPPDKLTVVYDFVSYLLRSSESQDVSAWQMVVASESVLKRDWERPQEDEAWANL